MLIEVRPRRARDDVGDEAFAAAWAEGRVLSLGAAVALALKQATPA